MSDHRAASFGEDPPRPARPNTADDSLLGLIDRCLASLPEGDPKQKLLYRMRHLVLQDERLRKETEAEGQKLKGVVEKLTSPANRVGTVLAVPGPGVARIVVGNAEYHAAVDPRLPEGQLKVGVQVLVNEAFAVIQSMGYEPGGPIVKVVECLPDGRLRIGQEPNGQSAFVLRSADLADATFGDGDEVRVDSSHRVAVERLEAKGGRDRLLDEVPNVTWEQIGGQREAITAIRKSIESPLLHAETFQRFKFTPPKGFLLYGPPGCGKTLIGKATAASLAASLSRDGPTSTGDGASTPATRGAFLHVKGPEILNMWLGESERLVRDLFAQARARRSAGALPIVFIDEAESILGTRRAMRSLNIANTLVPMFCAEMDGIASLRDVVIILASNRPDLIDPAVLRPGRIDRKIKVGRPGRDEAAEVLGIHLEGVPVDPGLAAQHAGEPIGARNALVSAAIDALFRRDEGNKVLAVRLRSGLRETLYRADVVSGAILAAIAQRAKERAIERTIEHEGEQGVSAGDLAAAIDAEYAQGEILPPDDAAEEWLKLLDHHPQQVVGVTSLRQGREGREQPIQVV
jgi:proteasome-associated ATPase